MILKKTFPKTFSLFVIFFLFFTTFFILAQECQTVEECTKILKELEAKIAEYEKDIQKTAKEKNTLYNQIALLKKKIEKLELEIRQSNVMIRDISLQIKDTETSIFKTNLTLEEKKRQLGEILKAIYEADRKSLLEILLTEESFSSFFDNLFYLEVLSSKSKELLGTIKKLKKDLEEQKSILDKEKENLENVLRMQILQKKESESIKAEKENLSKLTEQQYQKLLAEKKAIEKRAAEIRNRIFELIGVSKAPTFGEAVELAKWVEKITGVRPAFLLAVLTQESNIGKNVGQCYLKDPKTGEGIKISTGEKIKNVMHPSRDVPIFLEITKEVDRDPFATPVSCPISWVGGWGGAMGPAQFIPSTWQKYKSRVSEITGRPADPWNIKDAFLAAALYLADYGAAEQTYQAEWRAAMIYFSGTTNPRYRFYGDSVMRIAAGYEEDIKTLEAQKLTQSFLESFNNRFQLSFHYVF